MNTLLPTLPRPRLKWRRNMASQIDWALQPLTTLQKIQPWFEKWQLNSPPLAWNGITFFTVVAASVTLYILQRETSSLRRPLDLTMTPVGDNLAATANFTTLSRGCRALRNVLNNSRNSVILAFAAITRLAGIHIMTCTLALSSLNGQSSQLLQSEPELANE